tara:strand:+ start:6523 stop:7023 length:501 start_codon:yes stop_codon:yes gene_type:complete
MYWDEGNSKAVSPRFRHDGEQHNGLIIKQMPMPSPAGDMAGGMGMPPMPPAPPKSAIGVMLDETDSMIQALGDHMGGIGQLLSQSRATGIDTQTTLSLQGDMEKLRQKALSLLQDVGMIKEMHASLSQHGPPVNDPMLAASMQQDPMNMPQQMPPQDAATMPQDAM